MIHEHEIRELLQHASSLHPEDPAIYTYWEKLTALLSVSETETIHFLNTLTDENEISQVSSVFEDLSARLQSKAFIDCIEKMEQRFSDIPLHYMVEAAKQAMNDEDDGV